MKRKSSCVLTMDSPGPVDVEGPITESGNLQGLMKQEQCLICYLTYQPSRL